jgi:UDP-N-acetylmuramate--alanine ligase
MIEYSRIKKIHFVGIGGSGMSGIAEVLFNMGFIVSGSDISESGAVKRLKAVGIKIALGHRKENVAGVETVVYSSAVKKDNAEVKTALEMGIPVIPRAEMLAELMRLKFAVAVAGTHGKTSTTSMIAAIFDRAGMDPTYVVGGKLKTGESGAKLGKSEYLVAEADESDGSFLRLFPTLAIITNIENDHLDYYKTMENLKEAFVKFGNMVPFYGSVILNIDCELSRSLLPSINKRVITYSLDRAAAPEISPGTHIWAENIKTTAFEAYFDLHVAGETPVTIKLNVGGRHNVSNALAAIAVSLEIGVDFLNIKEGLAHFSLPERRFQVLFYNEDYVVLDDYAHHPTEIEATLETLKSGDFKRIIAVFQPHRYTRLELLMDKFASSFSLADKLIIAELYKANQEEIEDVNSRKLCEMIKQEGVADVMYIEDFDGIIDYLKKEIKKGDAVVFLTAGNLTQTAHGFARLLSKGG